MLFWFFFVLFCHYFWLYNESRVRVCNGKNTPGRWLCVCFYSNRECRYSAAPCQEAAEKETEDVQKAHKWLRDKFEEALGNIDF